jgi:hypothetical protein
MEAFQMAERRNINPNVNDNEEQANSSEVDKKKQQQDTGLGGAALKGAGVKKP